MYDKIGRFNGYYYMVIYMVIDFYLRYEYEQRSSNAKVYIRKFEHYHCDYDVCYTSTSKNIQQINPNLLLYSNISQIIS